MAEKPFKVTIDVETDFGGRNDGVDGLDKGMPIIFSLLKNRGIKALFFVSTEVMDKRLSIVQDILNEGHEVGNHGHFHVPYKEPWRQIQNKNIADNVLRNFTNRDYHHFRAPKFSYVMHGHRYSDPKGHVGLLKYMWFGGKIKDDTIFYLHPFDIVGGSNPPNLFCKLWYSNPGRARETLTSLLNQCPGDNRLS